MRKRSLDTPVVLPAAGVAPKTMVQVRKHSIARRLIGCECDLRPPDGAAAAAGVVVPAGFAPNGVAPKIPPLVPLVPVPAFTVPDDAPPNKPPVVLGLVAPPNRGLLPPAGALAAGVAGFAPNRPPPADPKAFDAAPVPAVPAVPDGADPKIPPPVVPPPPKSPPPVAPAAGVVEVFVLVPKSPPPAAGAAGVLAPKSPVPVPGVVVFAGVLPNPLNAPPAGAEDVFVVLDCPKIPPPAAGALVPVLLPNRPPPVFARTYLRISANVQGGKVRTSKS